MLIASSPVELDVEAAEAGLSQAAHDAARALFHTLTDRLGLAVAALSVAHQDWPTHRFYFSTEPDSLAPLLEGLKARADILDVSESLGRLSRVAARPGGLAGLYCRGASDGFEAVLVGHESHEGYLSPHRGKS